MTLPTIIAGTWSDGVFVFAGDAQRRALVGREVRALVADRDQGVLAIVDGHSLCRLSTDGAWQTLARSELDLACLAVVGDVIYLGTDDARILRLAAGGTIERLPGFDAAPGRATWYAGSALIDGRLVGPPLGVRSMTATSDGAVLLANVHVGGIPRSTDGGVQWQATIDIDSDVHEVCAHPARSDIVIAAAAAGLCISRDGGATWAIEQQGLHATYCSAVAFLEDDILVAAATDHFASRGVVYRRPIDGKHRLQAIDRLPTLEGIIDTGCLAARGSVIAVADKAGNLHASADAGRSWKRFDGSLPTMSSVVLR